MRNPERVGKWIATGFGCWILVVLGCIGGLLYVAVHFLAKVW